jgi:RNA polymerase sigma-70 factor, ECF subfamily
VTSLDSAIRNDPSTRDQSCICRRPISDVPSFADLYATHFSFVWSMAGRLGVDAAELDDIVQDIFVTVYERLYTLKRPEALRSWIYGIVRRVVCTYRRTKRMALQTPETVSLEPEMVILELTTPQQLAEQSEQVKLLWSMLEKLDPPKREIFVLTELEEMTAPEIAAAIDAPLNTVYSRLRAARHELEELLQRHHARTLKPVRTCPKRVPVCPN